MDKRYIRTDKNGNQYINSVSGYKLFYNNGVVTKQFGLVPTQQDLMDIQECIGMIKEVDEINAKAIELMRNGLGYVQTANKLGINFDALRARMRKIGFNNFKDIRQWLNGQKNSHKN
jgi:hypothetical protein